MMKVSWRAANLVENFTSQEVDLSVNISGVLTNKIWVSVGAAGSNIHEATKDSHTVTYNQYIDPYRALFDNSPLKYQYSSSFPRVLVSMQH